MTNLTDSLHAAQMSIDMGFPLEAIDHLNNGGWSVTFNPVGHSVGTVRLEHPEGYGRSGANLTQAITRTFTEVS